MKWMIIPLLIVPLVFSSCTSFSTLKEQNVSEVRTALENVIQTASERIEATMHAQLSLEELIPSSSQPLLLQKDIPRLDEHLMSWKAQVLSAFRGATIAMPSLLETFRLRLVIEDPLALMRQSDTSATALLNSQFGPAIEKASKELLAIHLQESNATWQMLTDRYGIWSRTHALVGQESLPELDDNITDHLFKTFFTSYWDELTKEELYLRTTPVFQGTGSFYELLNKKVQP